LNKDEKINDIRNLDTIIEDAHCDADTNHIHLSGPNKTKGKFNQILKAYEDRNSVSNVENRRGNNKFAN
jgi:hypothetical protein